MFPYPTLYHRCVHAYDIMNFFKKRLKLWVHGETVAGDCNKTSICFNRMKMFTLVPYYYILFRNIFFKTNLLLKHEKEVKPI